ncbi:MAG: hypothetical protein ACPL0C_01705 [Candidatus Bathyarchaeales archaeon]
MLDIVLAVAALISGLSLLIFASDKAVEHSINVASILKVSPLMIGLLIVSLGTDLPEIANSVFSSFRGHGDINVGDSFGSVLAQISLMLGLYAILARESFKVRRDEITVIGACEILALIASIAMVEKGYISFMNAVFLVASWPLLMLIVRRTIKQESPPVANTSRGLFYIY